jgi:hypothetical protein
MRPKIVAGILLIGTCLFVLILFASKAVRPPPPAALVESGVAPISPANASPVKAVKIHAATPPAFFPAPAPIPEDPAVHEKYVVQRIKELNDLAMNNDAESRDAILSEVKDNPDRRIRAAALEAAIQFDDRSVVPTLQDIAAQTVDSQEKQNILDAIDYINLPSLTEYVAANPPTSPNSNATRHVRRNSTPPAEQTSLATPASQ